MNIEFISPSTLQLYADCPRCFLLKAQGKRQVTTGAMAFGTRLHKAIERYHKEGLFEFSEDIADYMELYMLEYDRDYQVAEEFWKVDLFDSGVTLRLKIDLIKDDFLIEHKTSSRPYTQQFVDMHRQATAYSWAWGQLYTEREKAIRFNIFVTNPKPDEELLQILETHRTGADFLEWEEWVRSILVGIENDEFEPLPARWHNYPECPMYKERE